MELKNKIAIVTGASKGIGRSCCYELIKKGVVVYAIARTEQLLVEAKKELGASFHPIVLDLTNFSAIKEWLAKEFSDKYSPDIIINNAGIGYLEKITNLTLDNWKTMIDLNLTACYIMCHLLIPYMKSKQEGHIINIGSIAGLKAGGLTSGYSATKFGLRGFSQALFEELRHYYIKVTYIAPGSVQTCFFDEIKDIEAHQNMLQPKDITQCIVQVLETPKNMLVSELVVRPLNPNPPVI